MLLLVFLLAWPALHTAVPLAPFSQVLPALKKSAHPLAPSSLWSPKLKPPYPTNAWWIDAVLEDGATGITPEPYTVWMQPDGLMVALNKKEVAPNTNYILKVFNWAVKFKHATSVMHQITAYDALSVTGEYMDSKTKEPLVTYPIVRGSPYLTASFKAGVLPSLTFIHCYLTAATGNGAAKGHGVVSGTRFLLTLNNTLQTWVLYADKEISLQWDATSIRGTAAPKADWTLRLAAIDFDVQVPAATDVLDKHAPCVPLGGTVDADVGDSDAVTQFQWRAATSSGRSCSPLILALPHQQGLMSKSSHTFTSLSYDGLLGPMVGVVGETWTYQQNLVDVGWHASEPIDKDKQAGIIKQLKEDIVSVGFAPEPYSFGKQVCRFARASLIAEALGQKGLMEAADDIIRSAFAPYTGLKPPPKKVEATAAPKVPEGPPGGWGPGGPPGAAAGGAAGGAAMAADEMLFDTTWNGVVPVNGLKFADADFGAGYYNDHHFHYGYWIYAAAVLAKHDPTWGKASRAFFTALARDIANPSSADPYFPVNRYFDWYAGHSWASGLMQFTSGRNQESISEAMNAWYGLQLYATAIGDDNMLRTARVLLCSEMEAGRVYWRSTKSHTVYPPAFAKHTGVGMIWEDKVAIETWFGAGPVYALAINMMPFTPVTQHYLRKEWVRESFPILEKALAAGTYQAEWEVVVYMAQAIIDPQAAWKTLSSIAVRSDEGMTRSNVLWWVATRPSPTKPDPPIPQPANSPRSVSRRPPPAATSTSDGANAEPAAGIDSAAESEVSPESSATGETQTDKSADKSADAEAPAQHDGHGKKWTFAIAFGSLVVYVGLHIYRGSFGITAEEELGLVRGGNPANRPYYTPIGG